MVTVNYRDPRPIYEQIKDSLRRLIVTEAVAADERLPSVRELAQQLAINPNTIQRAYRELESEGYIYSIPGKGNFAGEKHEVDTGRREQLMQQLAETARELRYLGVSGDELLSCISEGGSKQ